MRDKKLVVIAAVAIVTSSIVRAEDAIRSDCRASVTPIASLKFNPGKHRLWYESFWNSQCSGLQPLGFPPWGDNCTKSEGGWNDAVTRLVGSASEAGKAMARDKVCRLGELIGYEWAKDNDIRCINTDDLKELKRLLEARDGNLEAVLDRIERRAKEICTRAGSKRTRALVVPKKA